MPGGAGAHPSQARGDQGTSCPCEAIVARASRFLEQMLHHSGSDNPCRHSPSNESFPEESREFREFNEFDGETWSGTGCRASSLVMSFLRSPWQLTVLPIQTNK